LEAVTLPTDSHRLDLLHSIQDVSSFERRLTCFLDYLIDYTTALNLDLCHATDRDSAGFRDKKSHRRIREMASSLGVTVGDDDYRESLDLVGAGRGNLKASIEDLIEENRNLKIQQRASFRSEGVVDNGQRIDLKRHFDQIESDLATVRHDVHHKFEGLKRY
jgi:hypothetical protein